MADHPELFPCPCGATRERECRMPRVCARANWRDTVYGSDSKVEAALHGSTALDAVLRAWALDAADPLALLARMAEGEAPESIVQELRQALHDTGLSTGPDSVT
jgi:hypothetical protein